MGALYSSDCVFFYVFLKGEPRISFEQVFIIGFVDYFLIPIVKQLPDQPQRAGCCPTPRTLRFAEP